MQVTGETLERAMAALEGRTTTPGPQSEPHADPAPGPAPDPAPAGNGEADAADVDSAHSESDEGGETATMPDGRRTPKRRNHLRGL
ncbi:hypothetical protein [Streptomyces decoyicus]